MLARTYELESNKTRPREAQVAAGTGRDARPPRVVLNLPAQPGMVDTREQVHGSTRPGGYPCTGVCVTKPAIEPARQLRRTGQAGQEPCGRQAGSQPGSQAAR
jgi:hypothetical protein